MCMYTTCGVEIVTFSLFAHRFSQTASNFIVQNRRQVLELFLQRVTEKLFRKYKYLRFDPYNSAEVPGWLCVTPAPPSRPSPPTAAKCGSKNAATGRANVVLVQVSSLLQNNRMAMWLLCCPLGPLRLPKSCISTRLQSS
jgi:hypothetical protein